MLSMSSLDASPRTIYHTELNYIIRFVDEETASVIIARFRIKVANQMEYNGRK
eukprot:m.24659 g.24659  ORF g.24659 m.24659 type:complete len:53 (+) comp7628_c0_seq2:794-952(+)